MPCDWAGCSRLRDLAYFDFPEFTQGCGIDFRRVILNRELELNFNTLWRGGQRMQGEREIVYKRRGLKWFLKSIVLQFFLL